MKNKFKNLALAALSLAAVADAAVPTTPTQSKTEQRSEKKLPTKQIKQTKEIKFNGYGGIEYTPFDGGISPKMFGQYLQQIGKQKWNKKKRKK